ncbi:MAG TPA: Dabb family protein [Geobacteraceae bacterium]|nr:Dabb family protein [Geobacteraceae bacterium]
MVTHIVFFKLKDRSAAAIAQAKEKLLSMDGKIDLLRHLEVGADIVRSERSYDLALVTKFGSMADLQAYQVHPYHAGEVIPYMKTAAESVIAVDYES